MRKIFVLLILVCANLLALSQITTEPAFPVAGEPVRIVFDSKLDSKLGAFSQELYAHTGVGIENGSNWQHVIGDWGQNNTQPMLTFLGNGVYELLIDPSINAYYGVTSEQKVINMSFVFRNSAGTKQTNDLFVTVYQSGLNIDLQFPTSNAILETGRSYTFSATASSASTLKMYLNNELKKTVSGTTIEYVVQYTAPADLTILVTAANSEGMVASDSASACVMSGQLSQQLPAGARKGITYPDNQSARLVLFAPGKSYVFVLGDFNNWKPMNSYRMKKDGDYFWLDLPGLQSGKEYIFQYLIDGELLIADPYAEKVSDPWSDSDISPSTYPELIGYPVNKTGGIASVLQPGQQPYQWEVPNFEIPNPNEMVIYELLIRDFSEAHSYQSVIDKLDYLSDLQINVLELMPVNEFEGNSSWGYNPSFYFAPDKYYGPKNDLKRLIDECHKRGIAVVIDMVLNHSFGQSPLARMYWDEANSRPSADNPWYNTVSPNQSYYWGFDFNHESSYTRELVDSVNSFWMSEYKVDGFRFDFTKGFTNKPGDGWAYDASRISILKRMADEIWKRKNGALVICEHLADNTEEKELANHGLLLWGNMNYNYGEAAMGYTESNKSDLSGGIYKQRGWSTPNLITYQESHDEERLTYKCLEYGNSNSGYDIKQQATALERMKLNAVFHLPLPGPKMIWQFGELGYDYSINTCDDGVTVNDNCRLSEKPIRWDYVYSADRLGLFEVVASLNYLKQTYEEFTAPTNFSYSLTGAQKKYQLTFNNNHVVTVGNFAVTEATMSVSFPTTGTWYDYFNESTFLVEGENVNITLQPGEYRLFSTREFQHPDIKTEVIEGRIRNRMFEFFPNPVGGQLTVIGSDLDRVDIYDLSGKKVSSVLFTTSSQQQVVDIHSLRQGIYFLKAMGTNGGVSTGKFFRQ